MRYPFDWQAEDDLDAWEAEQFGSLESRWSDDQWLFPFPRFRFLCPWRRRTP